MKSPSDLLDARHGLAKPLWRADLREHPPVGLPIPPSARYRIRFSRIRTGACGKAPGQAVRDLLITARLRVGATGRGWVMWVHSHDPIPHSLRLDTLPTGLPPLEGKVAWGTTLCLSVYPQTRRGAARFLQRFMGDPPEGVTVYTDTCRLSADITVGILELRLPSEADREIEQECWRHHGILDEEFEIVPDRFIAGRHEVKTVNAKGRPNRRPWTIRFELEDDPLA